MNREVMTCTGYLAHICFVKFKSKANNEKAVSPCAVNSKEKFFDEADLHLLKDLTEKKYTMLNNYWEEIEYFIIANNGVTEQCYNDIHLDDLQCTIANAMGLKTRDIKLYYLVGNDKALESNSVKRVILINPDKKTPKFVMTVPYSIFKEPSTELKVKIRLNDNCYKLINVNVFKHSKGLDWQGGYRNRKTGLYYIHSSSQTYSMMSSKLKWSNNYFTRDTQTHGTLIEVGTDISVDHSTQMFRKGYYIPSDTDKIITPSKYVPYVAINKDDNESKAAKIIQKCWKEYHNNKNSEAAEKEITNLHEKSNNYINAKNNFLSTKYVQDLYYTLTNFKICLKNSNTYNHEYTKKAMLLLSLDKEIDILKKIFQRNIPITSSFQSQNENILQKASSPSLKINYDEQTLYLIDKKGVQRCRELKELFYLYKRSDISIKSRLEVLMLLKQFIDAYVDFEMREEFLELINREGILLAMGVQPAYLNGLRKRCEVILLNFVMNPDYNPILLSFKKIQKSELFKCKSCGRFKPNYKFDVDPTNYKIGPCKSCSFRYQTCYKPYNLSVLETLYERIITTEFKRGCDNPYICLLDPKNLYEIVKIWNEKSIISNNKLLEALDLPRWDINRPWSPWNCILLTIPEAERHLAVENIYTFYGKHFCDIVKSRHLTAKLKFCPMIEFEIRNRRNWMKLPEGR